VRLLSCGTPAEKSDHRCCPLWTRKNPKPGGSFRELAQEFSESAGDGETRRSISPCWGTKGIGERGSLGIEESTMDLLIGFCEKTQRRRKTETEKTTGREV
jgi:hypothetical protein